MAHRHLFAGLAVPMLRLFRRLAVQEFVKFGRLLVRLLVRSIGGLTVHLIGSSVQVDWLLVKYYSAFYSINLCGYSLARLDIYLLVNLN